MTMSKLQNLLTALNHSVECLRFSTENRRVNQETPELVRTTLVEVNVTPEMRLEATLMDVQKDVPQFKKLKKPLSASRTENLALTSLQEQPLKETKTTQLLQLPLPTEKSETVSTLKKVVNKEIEQSSSDVWAKIQQNVVDGKIKLIKHVYTTPVDDLIDVLPYSGVERLTAMLNAEKKTQEPEERNAIIRRVVEDSLMVIKKERSKEAVARNLGYNAFGAIKQSGIESLISFQFRVALNEAKWRYQSNRFNLGTNPDLGYRELVVPKTDIILRVSDAQHDALVKFEDRDLRERL